MAYVSCSRRNSSGFVGLAVMVGSLIGVGCSSEPADDAPGSNLGAQTTAVDDGGLFCNALTVLRDNCTSCHNPARVAGAPMSLQTYQELVAPAFSDPAQTVYQLIAARIHDPVRPMPQPPAVLDPAAMATLDAWIAGGAKPGLDPTCSQVGAAGSGAGVTASAAGTVATAGTGVVVGDTAGTGVAGAGAAGTGEVTAGTMAAAGTGALGDDWPADCEEIHTITAYGGSDTSSKYTVPAGSEEHPQFSWTSPWGSDEVQAVKFRPITDNISVLHHWILYGPSSPGALFGTDKFITGWAPGSEAEELPANVGMYLPSGTLRLDLHYYNKAGGAASDKSGVEICVIKNKANFREFTAGVIGLTGSATANAATTTSTPVTCTAQTTSGPVTLLGVSPHMHKLGTRGYLALTPAAGGTPTVLHDQPFAFEDQRGWPLDMIQVNNGDKLTTRCTYVNPTDTTVRFGQDTDDEMCFNFTTYYPYGTLTCGQSL